MSEVDLWFCHLVGRSTSAPAIRRSIPIQTAHSIGLQFLVYSFLSAPLASRMLGMSLVEFMGDAHSVAVSLFNQIDRLLRQTFLIFVEEMSSTML